MSIWELVTFLVSTVEFDKPVKDNKYDNHPLADIFLFATVPFPYRATDTCLHFKNKQTNLYHARCRIPTRSQIPENEIIYFCKLVFVRFRVIFQFSYRVIHCWRVDLFHHGYKFPALKIASTELEHSPK